MADETQDGAGDMGLTIRRALPQDLPGVDKLLSEVLEVHASQRPDIFIPGTRKYADEELLDIFADDRRPVFVAVEEGAPAGEVLGYAFCVWEEFAGSINMEPMRTLYIDDICVDEPARGRHVATSLYRHVLAYAREQGFYRVTLNVWDCNPGARAFYDRMGMAPLKTTMEQVL